MSSRAGGIEHMPEDPGSLTGSPAYHRRGQVLRRRGLRHAQSESRFRYTISAGAAVTPPPGKLLTRKPNSFVISTFPASRSPVAT